MTRPFWGYEDLALFFGAVLPSVGIAAITVRPFHFPNEGVRTVAFQCVFYALLLSVLYFLIAKRQGRPLWSSLGWTFQFPPLWGAAGPPLAISLAVLAGALHAPEEPLIQNLITDRLSLILLMIFGVLIGPVFEELVFRGFLLPVLADSLGDWGGIVLAAALFALLHGPEYHWAWQVLLTVGLAGVVFGIARAKTGSTAAAATLHIGYNATLFAGFLVQRSI